MPETDAVPTVVPPEQLVGAEDCGPKTLKVIVPEAPTPELSVELMELAGMAVPRVPFAGPLAVTVGHALEIVSVWVAEVSDPEAAVIFGLPAWVSP